MDKVYSQHSFINAFWGPTSVDLLSIVVSITCTFSALRAIARNEAICFHLYKLF